MQMPERALGVVKRQLRLRRLALEAGGFAFAAIVVAGSAIWAKEVRYAPPLAAVSMPPLTAIDRVPANDRTVGSDPAPVVEAEASAIEEAVPALTGPSRAESADPQTRWFNGRPVRPARQIWMTVTAYSPDSRSCGESADGVTATLHDVSTNAWRLVAADPRLLKYGSMLSIPGYDQESIVPVLDCGGRIKGSRLDVLFPTHAQARAWGVRRIKVTVWGYADGKPADDPRRLR